MGAQALANVGFFAVLPFLTQHLESSLALSTAAIGLVLGVRTASQQGMFVVGGSLADTWGPRTLGFAGCAVRIAGFLFLGWSTTLAGVLVGAVLTGLGGAMFSPSLEATLSHATESSELREWFARFAAVGDVGALLGPALVGLASGVGFREVCTASAALFAVLALVLWVSLPTSLGVESNGSSLAAALRNRRFVAFAALTGVQLFGYNQLYFALPLEASATLREPERAVALMFIATSLLVALGQVPLSRAVRRFNAAHVIPAGMGVMALAFLVPPVARALGLPALAGLGVGALVLMAGHMLVSPTALATISDFAGDHARGAFHGLLATCGGAAVLLGNTLVGPLLEPVSPGHPGHVSGAAGVPLLGWVVLAAILAAAGASLAPVLRHHSHPSSPRKVHT